MAAASMLALAAGSALAHKASDAYLQLEKSGHETRLRVDVALRDLDAAVDIDADADGRLTWREVRAAQPAIAAYLHAHLQLPGCELGAPMHSLERRIDGAYAALSWRGLCDAAATPAIRYTVLADIDPTHRGIARIEVAGEAPALRVLDPMRPHVDEAQPSPARGAFTFLAEGVHHIVTGYDHVLFLLCLLLPSVMRRTPEGWRPVPRLRDAVLPVIGIVTMFTLAHSVTLALAATGRVALPPWLVEPAIAATIVLAALDNLRPIFGGRRMLVTFAFGLIHGFGFAGVLGEMDLPVAQFALALLEFNIGLELGQVAIVAAATALLFLLRGAARYPRWAIGGGSVAAIAVGVLWFIERTADVSLLPL